MGRITRVSAEVVSLPIEPAVLRPTGGGIRFIDNVVIHVDTVDGVRGSSYVWTHSARELAKPSATELVFAIQASVAPVADAVLDKDVEQYELIRGLISGIETTLGGGTITTAYSGVDMAIWDAFCKTLGVPLHQLLGRASLELGTYNNQLIQTWSDPAGDVATRARELCAAGFRSLKMPLSAYEPGVAVARVRAVRDAIGPDVGLAVDLGSAFSYDAAIKLCRRLEEFDLRWIEDPVAIEDVHSYARLCAELETPVGAGETCYHLQLFRRLLQSDALDLVIFEPMRIGGITGALKLIALTEAFGVPIAPHVYHNLGLHLLSGCRNAGLIEYLPWWNVLLESPVTVDGGSAAPRDVPGIGLQFDETALERYRVAETAVYER